MDDPKLAPSAPIEMPWSLAQRLGFRLAFAFWALLTFPFPIDTLPKADVFLKPLASGVEAVGVWSARNIFGITGNLAPSENNGSGDTYIQWSFMFVLVTVAILAALIWSVVDRRRRHYRGLHRVMRLILRYWLAYAMLSYGISMVFCMQMPSSLAYALEPFGQSSPMGLAWKFLGLSAPYEIFAGACECVAGVLLLFRRTTTLGALVCAGVMTNVFLMNMCYDIPVKLYSFELLLTGIFLALPSMEALINVLVLRRAVAADPFPARPRRRALVFAAIQVLFTAWILYKPIKEHLDAWDKYGPGVKKPSIAGIYDVKEYTRNFLPAPLLAPNRPARIAFDSWMGSFLFTNGRFGGFWPQYQEDARTLVFRTRGGPGFFTWTAQGDDGLELVGLYDGAYVTLSLKKADMSKELVYTRGFHWVNEFPLNR